MLRKVSVLLFLLIILPSANVLAQRTTAQYETPCEIQEFNERIDAILADYASTRSIDSSTDGSLASVAALQRELDSAHSACLMQQREARTEELTALLSDLREGGYIIYVRHTHTDRTGMGHTERAGCDSQRNLSRRGRDEALAINAVFTELSLPIDTLISTELCRTLDTAELAFGQPDEIIERAVLEETLAQRLIVSPAPGKNTIIVAHIGTINRNFGLPIPFDEGDAYVFRPMGERGTVLIGRIALLGWELLAEMQ